MKSLTKTNNDIPHIRRVRLIFCICNAELYAKCFKENIEEEVGIYIIRVAKVRKVMDEGMEYGPSPVDCLFPHDC